MSKENVCDICRKIMSPYTWWGRVTQPKILGYGKREMDVCGECMQLVAQARSQVEVKAKLGETK